MRIVQVAPLSAPVSASVTNPRARCMHYLTEELVRRGHTVTVLAAADSKTSATLVPACWGASEHANRAGERQFSELEQLHALQVRAGQFDVVHFHTEPIHFPVAAALRRPHVTTLHGALNSQDHGSLFSEFLDVPIVSTSFFQRRSMPWLNWRATIPYAMPRNLIPFSRTPGDYLLFFDDISPDTRLDLAIAIARQSDMPLRIAGSIDPENRPYYERRIAPLLDPEDPELAYISHLTQQERLLLISGARALIVPATCADFGGMALIEAAASGTPVIAMREGIAPELIEDGGNGCVVSSIAEALRAAALVRQIDRSGCRDVFETRFTIEKAADRYSEVYEGLQV